METINIQTKRLNIRQLALTDLSDFFLYRSNPEVTKYQGFDVMTLEESKNFIINNAINYTTETEEWVQYAIENKETKKIIGDCAIKIEKIIQTAEVGITISHLEQQKGFGKETLLGILDFLFEIKQIHRVVEIVDVENIASINLLKSVGFRKEAHYIENIFFKGKWASEFQYAMLKREWNDIKSKYV